MGFFNSIKKWFFKEKEVGIINIGDIIQIPDRSFYKDDIETINLINTYKEKYLQLLFQKRTITTKELKLDSLQEDMIMNVDLLLHNVITDDYFLNLAPEELMIQMVKFKLYLSEINKMEVETITRLIALKELQKGMRIPHRNKNCLTDEINSLSISLVIFWGQKTAIQKEIGAYLRTISTNNSGIDNELLNQRYEKLAFISSSIFLRNDTDKIDNQIAKIALIEKSLEIYAYKNKDEIKLLDSQLKELNNIKKTKNNKKDLLHKISSLEQKYLLFYEYGRNVISEEQMQSLYKVKFDILTCDIDYIRESPIKQSDYGYSYYKIIIMKKIEEILRGNNINVNETFKERTIDAINIISNSFKNNNDEFDLDEILKDKFMLNLIISFDRKNGFREMLVNNILLTTISEEFANFYESHLLSVYHDYWDSTVPLKSYLSVIQIPDLHQKSFKKWNIYGLYKIIEEFDLKSDVYEVPEGIKYLDRTKMPIVHFDQLREKSKGKILIMPSTLRTLDSNIFSGKHIVLNDGLEVIGENSLLSIGNPIITIPSSVKVVDEKAFNTDILKTIIFDDFTNSQILHDKEALIKMLKPFFYKHKTGNKEFHFVSERVKEKQKAYWEERYSTFADWELFDHEGWIYEVEDTSTLDYIILKDGDATITIKREELSLINYVDIWYTRANTMESDYYSSMKLIDKMQEVILEKTGHDIFKEENQKVRAK